MNTPRTDAAFDMAGRHSSPTSWRTEVKEKMTELERELAEAKETIAQLIDSGDARSEVAKHFMDKLHDREASLESEGAKALNAMQERDNLRAELSEARSTVEKCWECETKLRAEIERNSDNEKWRNDIELKLKIQLAQANERIEAKQQAYERCAEQLAEAKKQVAEQTDSILSHMKTATEMQARALKAESENECLRDALKQIAAGLYKFRNDTGMPDSKATALKALTKEELK